MAGEKTQKQRLQQTPRKPKTPERFIIGSSSTWTEDELERFNVTVGGEVESGYNDTSPWEMV
jgi:hypothetical protein